MDKSMVLRLSVCLLVAVGVSLSMSPSAVAQEVIPGSDGLFGDPGVQSKRSAESFVVGGRPGNSVVADHWNYYATYDFTLLESHAQVNEVRVVAHEDGTTVRVDTDLDDTPEHTLNLNEGEMWEMSVPTGTHIWSDKELTVHQYDDFNFDYKEVMLPPVRIWDTDYFYGGILSLGLGSDYILITAAYNDTYVAIDLDNDGTPDSTNTLNEGEVWVTSVAATVLAGESLPGGNTVGYDTRAGAHIYTTTDNTFATPGGEVIQVHAYAQMSAFFGSAYNVLPSTSLGKEFFFPRVDTLAPLFYDQADKMIFVATQPNTTVDIDIDHDGITDTTINLTNVGDWEYWPHGSIDDAWSHGAHVASNEAIVAFYSSPGGGRGWDGFMSQMVPKMSARSDYWNSNGTFSQARSSTPFIHFFAFEDGTTLFRDTDNDGTADFTYNLDFRDGGQEIVATKEGEHFWVDDPDNHHVIMYQRIFSPASDTMSPISYQINPEQPTVRPTITLSSPSVDPVSGPITVTATLSEPSTDFTASDITTVNATVSGFSGSGETYTFTLTPLADGLFSAIVEVGTFTDAEGAPNFASDPLERTADLTLPSIVLSSLAGDPVTGAITVTATLSEPSADFTAADVTTVNATVSGFSGSDASYTFTLTPIADGLFSATVNAGTFTDLAGNPNTVSNTLSRTLDMTPPTIALTSPAGDPVNGAITVTAILSEPSADFTAADVSTSNATVSGFSGSGALYTFTLTPLAEGLFSATVNAGTFTDSVGNPNEASDPLSRTLDSTPPVITLLGNSPISIECGTPYVDAGATAADGVDGDITSSIVTVDSVNEFVLGSYFVTYDVVDAAGNAAIQVVRIVNVIDTTKPLIQLLGDSMVNVPKDSVYVDAGATASDSCEGDLTASIVTQSDVDTSIPGFYSVDYTVSDTSGNTADAARIVVVAVDNEDPCSALREAIETEWVLLAADLGLNPNIVEAPGNRIPERWALAMVRQIICRTSHPHHAATVEAYLHNLMMLETEPPLVSNRVAPYRHVLAALLLVNQSRQDHFKSLLGLTNVYDVVRGPRRGRGLGQEIFGDDGDLDRDGITNADVYDSVIVDGGDIEEFAEIVIRGVALTLSLVSALAAFLAIIMLSLVQLRDRDRSDAL